jgi:predicted membrane-bound spermidine synthase
MHRALARHAAFFAAGLLASASQVLLLRELIVDAAGDEAAIGIGLSAWLAGIALGAAVARRRPPERSAAHAGLGLSALAVLAPAAMMAGRLLRLWLAPGAGELPGLGLALVLAAATMAPSGAAVGWAFTALASSAARQWRAGEGITRLYVVESLGSLAGGLVVTLAAGSHVRPLRLAAVVSLTAAALALTSPRPTVSGRGALRAALLLGLGLAAAAGPLDARTERARFAAIAPGVSLRAFFDTPYQHVDVGGDDPVYLYSSGQYVTTFPDPYRAESLGSLVAILSPHPARVLLLGEAERGIVPVLLRHPVERLTLVEPDARAFDLLEPLWPEADRAALRDPRVRLVVDDPRRFLARSGTGPFDLVLLLGPSPDTLLRARLATVEFFRLLASRLDENGTLVMSLKTAPSALTGETAALVGSLVLALREALPVVRVTPGPEALVVAGWTAQAATLDPSALARRWRARGVRSSSFDAAVLPAILNPDRVATEEAAVARATAGEAPSRDDRPVSFVHALARRHEEASGRWGRLLAAASNVPPLALVLLAFVPSLGTLARTLRVRAPDARAAGTAAHAVAVAGAAGMGWSLLVLFAFQTHAGALHGQLGVLVALFMLGLSLGAALAARSLRTEPGRDAELPAARRSLLACLAAAVVFGATLPLTLGMAARASEGGALAAVLAYGALQLAAGVATGAVFPIAVAVRLAAREGGGEAAGRIETADHAGAAVAALFGAVLFVPLLGIARSAVLLAGLLALALALAGAGSVRGERERARPGGEEPSEK